MKQPEIYINKIKELIDRAQEFIEIINRQSGRTFEIKIKINQKGFHWHNQLLKQFRKILQ